MSLPACGLYRTTEPIGEVPASRLVYFHNHGDPGPGIYLPESWRQNRAQFSKRGTTLPSEELAHSLEALLPEGLYAVIDEFVCCEKRCQTFVADSLVQLGYNGAAEAILFLPTLGDDGLILPERGTRIEPDRLASLKPLRVAKAPAPPADKIH